VHPETFSPLPKSTAFVVSLLATFEWSLHTSTAMALVALTGTFHQPSIQTLYVGQVYI
jgi:hypothetical protein